MADQIHPKILGQTLGELMKNNNQAQGMVMQAMQINPQQLQELLNQTGNNQLMNMTIGDLFKNGIVQQAMNAGSQNSAAVGTAVPIQLTPEQAQQIVSSLNTQNTQNIIQGQTVVEGSGLPVMGVPVVTQDKPSFWQRLKKLF